jgi:phosphoribosyl-dephospho-CoA transferase
MYRRHDLVWLTPQGWDMLLPTLGGAALDLARGWRTRSLPAVVRRNDPGTPAGLLCLGIPAPPDAHSGQKVRLGFAIERSHVAEVRPALALDQVEAPAAWQPGLASLGLALRAAGIDCRVFGSLAMQTLTGKAYLGASSDVDLLLRPLNGAQMEAGLALLARHAQSLPLDGEIEFPFGHAVSWKEWLSSDTPNGADRVLAKHLDAVCLKRRDELLAQFGVDGGCHG